MTKKFGRPAKLNLPTKKMPRISNGLTPMSSKGGFDRARESGQRLFTVLSRQERVLTEKTLYERNMLLLDTLNELFGLESVTDIGQLKHRVGKDVVLKLYERIAAIFPQGTKLEHLLPPDSNNLRALFLGSSNPRNVLNNVSRYALYSDEIMLYSPFCNPWTTDPEINPLVRPEILLQDTLSALVLTAVLALWIRKGLVHLVPDPGDFDHDLRSRTSKLAEERVKNRKIVVDDIYRAEFEDNFDRFVFAAPDDVLYQSFKEFDPTMSETKLNSMILEAKRRNSRDPLALSQPTVEQIHMSRGGNLEIAAFVAQVTNAFPYTDLKSKWDEIRDCIKQFPLKNQPWSPLTESFQKLEFQFLDNVDPNFAYKLHEDGRLQSFRNYLRKIWKTHDTSDGTVPVRDFCDELNGEYLKAQGELNKLNADTIKSGTKLFGSIATGAGSLALGNMTVMLPSAWFLAQAIGELVAARFSYKAYRQNVPMSVFVDLSKKRR